MSIFSNNVVKKPTRSRFNLGFENKLTCNFGEIVPCMCKEVVPGDIFRCKSEVIVRMMPMLAPILQNIDVYTLYIFHSSLF